MILNSGFSFVFAICLHVGLTANLQRQELSISECAAKVGECDESKGRPVCGTDGQTYPTRCHLLRVQCSGHQVSIRYRGPCKACNEAREYALKHRTKNPLKFIPRCKKDGTYAPIQCLTDSGCWCSDITGTPIDNTPVRIVGKPKCRGFNKAYKRRSPSRNASGNKKRSCTQDDRAMFNANLIGLFQSEYLRVGSTLSKSRKADTFLPPADTEVLDWKFTNLDVNNNQMLDKNEYRELKKLVKRAVKPRRCGRAFGKFCDVDSDARLSRLEWNSCLSKDGINRHLLSMGQKHKNNTKTQRKNNHHDLHNNTAYRHTPAASVTTTKNTTQNQNHNNNNNNHHTTIQDNNQSHLNNHHLNQNHFNTHHSNNNHQNRLRPDSYENESNPADDEDDDDNSSHLADYDDPYYDDAEDDHLATINSPTKFPSININILSASGSGNTKLKDSENDYSGCFADRKDALTQNEENIKNGKKAGHVPVCAPDGRFLRVQCYDSICWCANEETGETLNGTSVKNRKPLCDTAYPVVRAMKGCPNEIKIVFLKELKEFLKTKIIANSNADTKESKWVSEDVRIATLSFVILDKNKNQLWERKEWKSFRELVTNNKTLRRCGRKMPRYCDVDSDKKVTFDEWSSCLQTQTVEPNPQPDFKPPTHSSSNDTSFLKPPKLNGTNPLTIYLT